MLGPETFGLCLMAEGFTAFEVRLRFYRGSTVTSVGDPP
jgi:multidrug efflux pump subunit AcrA (membrane-fusion protein)